MRKLVPIVLVAALVAGCGGGNSGSSSVPKPKHPAAPSSCSTQMRMILALAKEHPDAVSPKMKRLLPSLEAASRDPHAAQACATQLEELK